MKGMLQVQEIPFCTLAVMACNTYSKGIVGQEFWISKWLLKRIGWEQNGQSALCAVDHKMRRHSATNYTLGMQSRVDFGSGQA